MIEKLPGSRMPNNRRAPFGELNWIFTAVTDSIAWNVLPRELFHKLFRQDLLVASLFRNFLLAQRIIHSYGCNVCLGFASAPLETLGQHVFDENTIDCIMSSDPTNSFTSHVASVGSCC
jgi:hypothetical protein